MFTQDDLQELKAALGGWGPGSKFLIMFIGVVVGPLVLFVVGGRDSNTLGQFGLAWSFLAITLLLFVSIGLGFRMFGHVARDLSISPRYI